MIAPERKNGFVSQKNFALISLFLLVDAVVIAHASTGRICAVIAIWKLETGNQNEVKRRSDAAMEGSGNEGRWRKRRDVGRWAVEEGGVGKAEG